jgi:hypothetical protein
MTRKQTIVEMRIAGYHNDQHRRVELLVTGRVNREILNLAWDDGVMAKELGTACSCYECVRKAVRKVLNQ